MRTALSAAAIGLMIREKMDHEFEERLRHRAYAIWEAEGRPHGRDCAHWEQAQQELTGDLAIAPVKLPVEEGESAAVPAKPARARGGARKSAGSSGRSRKKAAEEQPRV